MQNAFWTPTLTWESSHTQRAALSPLSASLYAPRTHFCVWAMSQSCESLKIVLLASQDPVLLHLVCLQGIVREAVASAWLIEPRMCRQRALTASVQHGHEWTLSSLRGRRKHTTRAVVALKEQQETARVKNLYVKLAWKSFLSWLDWGLYKCEF